MSEPIGLLAKLHKIAKSISHIEKRGENKHHKYNFVQAVDVTRIVRDQLLKNKIVVIPGADAATHLAYGGKGGHLTTVELMYKFVDLETNDELEVPWIGVGADTGGDKGIYKAYTGGLKYMLLSLFLIPMTDDPERDQLTASPSTEEPEQHRDDARPAAPLIPLDRAQAILRAAITVGMATLDMEADPGTPPEFHPVFKAVLATHGVDKIGALSVDQAEAVEVFLVEEYETQKAKGE